MPRIISGLRFARSFLSPAGVQVAQAELDFQLATRQGIAIYAILGNMTNYGNSGLLGTNEESNPVVQTVHLETGALEAPLNAAGEDAVNIDTEIFYRQDLVLIGMAEAGGAGSYQASVTPNGLVSYQEAVLSARNITHRAETVEAAMLAECEVTIHYKYVEFSRSEMGVLLARRS